MEWYRDYDFIFSLFDKGDERVDETSFYFRSEDPSCDHFIGYLPQYDKPYWVGYCDIPNGCEYKTAKELFEAKIFDGKSLKDRWDETVILNIGGISIFDWKPSMFD